MQILQRISENTIALHFPDRMDETTNQDIREVLDQALVDDDQVFVLEFSAVQYLNSAAIGLLLAFVAQIRKSGRSCRTGEISDKAREILEAMRVLPHLTVSA